MIRDNASLEIARAALELGGNLPSSLTLSLAEAIRNADWGNFDTAKKAVVRDVPHGIHRHRIVQFIDRWLADPHGMPPSAVSMALVTAAEARGDGSEPFAEIVWTGPDAGVVPVRHTEQALLQLIGAAKQHLLIVSYAVYSIPRVTRALIEASARGVEIIIILETPSPKEGQRAYDTIRALGEGVAERCSVYIWPSESRVMDDSGRRGILHVKAASADGIRLFVSSANLTEYAFTINMELGVMITGGEVPGKVEHHFKRLIEMGSLVPITNA